jgi:hypothetical protein
LDILPIDMVFGNKGHGNIMLILTAQFLNFTFYVRFIQPCSINRSFRQNG